MSGKERAAEAGLGLSPERLRALFDILSHHETYAEIASFKSPEAISGYGFPFGAGGTNSTTASGSPSMGTPTPTPTPGSEKGQQAGDPPSAAPIMQLLLTRLALPLPGVSSLPGDFWSVRIQTLLQRLGDAELSESYEKGALGTRKVLATGSSSVLEMLARGMLGGLDEAEPPGSDTIKTTYDHGNAADLERAWDDVTQGLVYGDLVDQLFDHFVHSDDLDAFSPTVEASVRHNIYHIATLIHQIFVLSPEGQYLLKLIENVHGLVPFRLIGQTLRIGNAATMISGMVRIILAKLSVASVTNWLGWTQNEDDGMNLLQRIISVVLSWDASEFKKSADRVAKAKGGPSEDMLAAIREHIEKPRPEHDAVRLASKEKSQSIVTSIFDACNPNLNEQLTPHQHALCLEYYSARLSIRDRDRIATVFCRQTPDMLTQSVKDVVAAYDPIIRTVHSHVQLHVHFEDMQKFVEAFIKTSKPRKGSSGASSREQTMPSVEDYVELLMQHKDSLYRWIHALASQCPGLWDRFRVWANEMLARFRKRRRGEDASAEEQQERDMAAILNRLYADLDSDVRADVLAAIDAHAAHLETLSDLSRAKMAYLVTALGSSGGTTGGPGVYLSRWQALLDETLITPCEPAGTVRHGRDVKHITTMGKTGLGGEKLEESESAQRSEVEAPDVSVVIDALGGGFRHEIQGLVRVI